MIIVTPPSRCCSCSSRRAAGVPERRSRSPGGECCRAGAEARQDVHNGCVPAPVRPAHRAKACPRPHRRHPRRRGETRIEQRILKLAFYRAALDVGVPKPEWGCLTGVRPAKFLAGLMQKDGLTETAAVRMLTGNVRRVERACVSRSRRRARRGTRQKRCSRRRTCACTSASRSARRAAPIAAL